MCRLLAIIYDMEESMGGIGPFGLGHRADSVLASPVTLTPVARTPVVVT